MIVGIRDVSKLSGILVIVCCAVLVCSMFLNFWYDVTAMSDQITSGEAQVFYEAQVSTAKVVCIVSGGCLLATSVVMLIFYIRHFIDTRRKELGILKAMGFSAIRIAATFWVFGLSVFVGGALGLGGAWILMPHFYALQNEDHILPEIVIHFHPETVLFFVILPTVAFALLAVLYARIRLSAPPLALIRESDMFRPGAKRWRAKTAPDTGFLQDLRRRTLRSRKILTFFTVFAAFCFSAMTQMSFSMKDLSSGMMGAMILVIGLILASVTLVLAVTAVVRGNTKTVAMMRAFGYSGRECSSSILGVYRLPAYIGFAVGTVYQYLLLRIMVDVVFRDIPGVPEYGFDFPMMCVSLALFAILYELVVYGYSRRMRRLSVKEIMLE